MTIPTTNTIVIAMKTPVGGADTTEEPTGNTTTAINVVLSRTIQAMALHTLSAASGTMTSVDAATSTKAGMSAKATIRKAPVRTSTALAAPGRADGIGRNVGQWMNTPTVLAASQGTKVG